MIEKQEIHDVNLAIELFNIQQIILSPDIKSEYWLFNRVLRFCTEVQQEH